MSFIHLAPMFMSALLGVGQAEQQEPTTVEGVTVEARRESQQERLERVIETFIGDTAVTIERNGQLGRFDRRVCPGVMNVDPAIGQIIIDRIALAIQAVDLPVGRPGCDANLLVIVTEDSDRLATIMMERFGRVFEHHVSNQERGRDFLVDFGRSGQAIRTWHMTAIDTGQPPSAVLVAHGGRAIGGFDGGSRLRAAYETDIFGTIVIVDSQRVGPVDPAALGDYIAMTSLARISSNAETREVVSILNIFDDDAPDDVRAARLSNWDIGYLQALYTARGDVRTTRMQINDIAYRMGRRVNSSDLAPEDEDESSPSDE